MSSNLTLGSSATVKGTDVIKIVSTQNPEIIIIHTLVAYIRDVGYSEMYPNFDSVNVGAVHPFALLLFQEIQGQKLTLDVFPSITVADNSLSQDSDVLSDDRRDIIVDSDTLSWVQAKRDSGEWFVSDSNMAAIVAATDSGGELAGVMRTLTHSHSVTLSIWTANKDVTSLLFDLTTGFLLDKKTELKLSGLEIKQISGSRTGDINMDFGEILYGASVSVPMITQQTVISLDVSVGIISDVTVTQDMTADPGSQTKTVVVLTKQ